jgi:hypothetical protein
VCEAQDATVTVIDNEILEVFGGADFLFDFFKVFDSCVKVVQENGVGWLRQKQVVLGGWQFVYCSVAKVANGCTVETIVENATNNGNNCVLVRVGVD